jgi:hypothetical protein
LEKTNFLTFDSFESLNVGRDGAPILDLGGILFAINFGTCYGAKLTLRNFCQGKKLGTAAHQISSGGAIAQH